MVASLGGLDLRTRQPVTVKVCTLAHARKGNVLTRGPGTTPRPKYCISLPNLSCLPMSPGSKARGRRLSASQVQLESDLSMPCCNQIPVAAWQQLEGAMWPKLTKVNFGSCFDKESKGAEGAAGLLAALARCPELQELRMRYCDQIPASAWQQLEGAHWPKLTKVDFDECFDENSKGADGVAGLLTALARCPELEDASSLRL
ncbi:unnamed protein product [Symbiodinium necroappetens]|uniref:Uncharacterized protein n=1 Tax=Symbiodinium necroappetens TaxID=1628268 RepID=A0A812SWM3_9DINO|nr:unnamed protein product [Symbiodinium necroappetens]